MDLSLYQYNTQQAIRARTIIRMMNYEKELNELFNAENKMKLEEVYFRNSEKKHWLVDELNKKKNKHIVCYIVCEFGECYMETEKVHLHYDGNYWGSKELNDICDKYDLGIEWMDCCIAYIYQHNPPKEKKRKYKLKIVESLN